MITVERARELFSYDPETGIVTRKITTGPRARKGYTLDTVDEGYLVVRVDGRKYRVHRLIWFIVTGTWPKYEVDHEDRNKLNNKWKNLRDITATENVQNVASSQGGVSFVEKTQSWRATVQCYGKHIYIGGSKDRTVAEYLYELYCRKHLPHKL